MVYSSLPYIREPKWNVLATCDDDTEGGRKIEQLTRMHQHS